MKKFASNNLDGSTWAALTKCPAKTLTEASMLHSKFSCMFPDHEFQKVRVGPGQDSYSDEEQKEDSSFWPARTRKSWLRFTSPRR